jgi:hypothetical protein
MVGFEPFITHEFDYFCFFLYYQTKLLSLVTTTQPNVKNCVYHGILTSATDLDHFKCAYDEKLITRNEIFVLSHEFMPDYTGKEYLSS